MPLPAPTPSAFFLTERVTVQRQQAYQNGTPGNDIPVDDAAGREYGSFGSGGPNPWLPVAGLENLKCSIQPESGQARQQFSSRALDVDTAVYFARALSRSDIRADDRLVDARGEGYGVYVVQAVGDEAQQGRVSWVLCKRAF